MRLVFMGTPHLAASVLQALAREHEVVAVFTRPDAVRGRGKSLVASPVKDVATALGIPVYTPSSLKDAEVIEQLEELRPDVICVVAYGMLLPQAVLDIPRFGCLNVHTSLLPRWRGAAPIERSILTRDANAGVSIMKMEKGLDTGPYCRQVAVPIQDKYVAELADDLVNVGARELVQALAQVEAGTVAWTTQEEEGVTYADKIAKGELDCLPTDAIAVAHAKVRASSESHPSRLAIAGRVLTVEAASIVEDEAVRQAIGDLGAAEATSVMKRLFIGFDDGIMELEQVKPAGKKSMDGRSFAAGVQGIKNARLVWESA